MINLISALICAFGAAASMYLENYGFAILNTLLCLMNTALFMVNEIKKNKQNQ